ncbi:hypothetical protein KUV95_11825 [Microbulbifer agarilyticus]|uniref:hypothetical protein n=1 Tax=Microbulbifer agarilyticus TaxID=260552 RepID=UPI001C954CDB|nr:hypothetical protein [Microbulbifer agarilyticus]MBY6212240.1 hypothetical protein [Microbulbifer agarilyticus]
MKYFEALVSDESSLLFSRINAALENCESPYGHLKSVSEVLVHNQAELAARIKVLEQVLLGRLAPQELHKGLSVGEAPEHIYSLMSEFEVPVSTVAHQPNYYDLEQSENGSVYAWTGPAPEVLFEVPVKRDSKSVFRLGFIGAADEALLESVKILVDGQLANVDLDFDGTTRGLLCTIESRPGGGVTTVEVKLDRTISPAEQGQGNDARRLGLAVTGYKVYRA